LSRRQRQQSNESAQQSPNKNFSRGRNRTAQQTNNVVDINTYRRPVKNKVLLLPKNIAQENYIEKLEDPNINIVFAVGFAGTGKTYLATQYAISQLKAGAIDKVVISRPNIAVDDKDIGFLPGGILQKMAPWTRPIFDVFEEYYSVKEIAAMVEENVIELCPLGFIRGRTFKNSIVILDEAQNTTRNSMLSALTRIGEGSKMIITGDTRQTDRGRDNGLEDFLTRFKESRRIAICHFGRDAIERHPVISEILRMYGEE
jgi:phosphate starvation-inducible PhoH-like protein